MKKNNQKLIDKLHSADNLLELSHSSYMSAVNHLTLMMRYMLLAKKELDDVKAELCGVKEKL